MSILIEQKMIKDRAMVYWFEFDEFTCNKNDSNNSNPSQTYSVDKWMTIKNWSEIYERLQDFTFGYISSETMGPDKCYTIKDSPLKMTVSWIKINSALKQMTKLRSNDSYRHCLFIRIETHSEFDQLVTDLQNEIKSLRKLELNRIKEKLTKSDEHEEYIPERSFESTNENDLEYNPTTCSITVHRNQEYTPEATSASQSTELDDSVYVPSRKMKNEKYDPTQCTEKSSIEYTPKLTQNSSMSVIFVTSDDSERKSKTKQQSKMSNSKITTRRRKFIEPTSDTPKENKIERLDHDNLFGDNNSSDADLDGGKIVAETESKRLMAVDGGNDRRYGQPRKAKVMTSLNEDYLCAPMEAANATGTIQTDGTDRTIRKTNKKCSMKKIAKKQTNENKKTASVDLSTRFEQDQEQQQQHDPLENVKMLTPEEMARLNEQYDRKMKDIELLDERIKILDPELPNVDIISLKDMPIDDFILTYPTYRSKFNNLIHKYLNRKEAAFPRERDLSTLVTGDLLTDQQQLKVMEFLEKKYQQNDDGMSGLTELFWDNILPEWTLAIFMDKFKFSRSEAIERIRLQAKILADSSGNQSSLEI